LSFLGNIESFTYRFSTDFHAVSDFLICHSECLELLDFGRENLMSGRQIVERDFDLEGKERCGTNWARPRPIFCSAKSGREQANSLACV
jgi:hypothetical protein